MVFGHSLHRSSLSPSVPLDGSDTVAGLRTLERLHIANLYQTNNTPRASTSSTHATPQQRTARSANNEQHSSWTSRRKHYQRFKGPFIEQLSTDDLKRDPKPWKLFGVNGDNGSVNDAYTLPASLDILAERFEVSEELHLHQWQPTSPLFFHYSKR